MTKKEHVKKYGGKFNIRNGETWTAPNGHVVHFALSPKIGSCGVDITTGFHEPGKEFAPHKHPVSEEVLFIHQGKGECYLYDKWIPVEAGDVIYAPPGVMHGTRNPAENTEPFVTLGIGTPPKLDLYLKTGYDVLEDNSGEYED